MMKIVISYLGLYEAVERSLSIIGKRMIDDKGDLLFRDITLGTNEKEIISDYFRQAAIDIATETSAFIKEHWPDAATRCGCVCPLSMHLQCKHNTVPDGCCAGEVVILELPANHNDVLGRFIQKSCEAYCVSFALYSWFNITAPRLADKYAADCKRQMASVTRLIYEKKAPKGTHDIVSSTSTEIT